MANKKLFKTIGAITTGAFLLAAPSCTDTWDEHYDNQESAASQNLWEQIKSNPSLETFAEIASKAKYYKDNIHPVEGYTFADLLQSGQVLTVWAPENDAFTAEEKAKWLDMAENDGYNLQVQLMTNHIALWRHNVSFAKKDTLFMTNGKEMVFDKTGAIPTMYGVELVKNNISASNGTLHIIKDELPFHYNFYEYLKFSGEVPEFGQYVVDKDTTYFQESASIEGLPDENGNPTYVDSVYHTSNLMFNGSANASTSTEDKRHMSEKGFNAWLNDEAAKYIMAIPSDAVWKAAYDKLKPYYTYAPAYVDRGKSTVKDKVLRQSVNTDSLTDLSIRMDVATPLVFNVERQGKIGGEEGVTWTLDEFIETKGAEADYFLTTRGDTLRSIGEWDKTSIFNGELKEMSNGYGYILDEWSLPREFYRPDVEIKTASWQFNLFSETFEGTVGYQAFTNSQLPEIVAKYGRVSKDHFYIMSNGEKGKPEGDLILNGNYELAYAKGAQVMSGKYDVYMVMVPYWYKEMWDKQNDSLYLDSAYTASEANKYMNKFQVQITYDDGSAKGKTVKSGKIEYNAQKVDTLFVMEMEFPYSYKNLEHSYPLMNITSAASNPEAKNGYTHKLCIDRVILKSKVDDTVVEVDPSNI